MNRAANMGNEISIGGAKKYRKKPVVISAKQWFRDGDHPEVQAERRPTRDMCPQCRRAWGEHGRVVTLEGAHTVCPGDFIIQGVKGEFYPCKPDIFEATYEAVG
jgi:hypothetical protein